MKNKTETKEKQQIEKTRHTCFLYFGLFVEHRVLELAWSEGGGADGVPDAQRMDRTDDDCVRGHGMGGSSHGCAYFDHATGP